MEKSVLSKRERQILSYVVDHYLKTGDSIGSEEIINNYEVGCSSATVRNQLHKLMNRGLLTQKHISSGRLPTELGISYYVNSVLDLPGISEAIINQVLDEYDKIEGTIDQIIDRISGFLSDYTRTACLATLPDTRTMRIQSARIVGLGLRRYIVILVFEGGLTEKTYIKLDRDISNTQIEMIGDYLNKLMCGLTLENVRELFMHKVRYSKKEYSIFMENILRLSSEIFEKEAKVNYLISGKLTFAENNNLNNPEISRNLLHVFEEKNYLLNLLKNVDSGVGTKVFVGSHSGMPNGCSLVASNYGDGSRQGSLGIFGPIRMDYSLVIPLVNYTAKYLSRVLNQGGGYEYR